MGALMSFTGGGFAGWRKTLGSSPTGAALVGGKGAGFKQGGKGNGMALAKGIGMHHMLMGLAHIGGPDNHTGHDYGANACR